MTLKELMDIQHNFDAQHGWSLSSDSKEELIKWLNKDLVGLFGEIGELANIVKKINLEHDACSNDLNLQKQFQEQLKDEVVDSFIYIIRIAQHLKIDLTQSYLSKLEINRSRFKKYEHTK